MSWLSQANAPCNGYAYPESNRIFVLESYAIHLKGSNDVFALFVLWLRSEQLKGRSFEVNFPDEKDRNLFFWAQVWHQYAVLSPFEQKKR